MRIRRLGAAWLLLFAAGIWSGCTITVPHSGGTFDKTLTVTGPMTLEIRNSSGDVRISTGPAGQMQIHGEFEVNAAPWETTGRIAEEFKNSPPIEQQGNSIRIVRTRELFSRVSVNYTIVVPQDTELRATTGSGNIVVRGPRGVARLRAGSGDIEAGDLDNEAEAETGSGDIRLSNITGRVRARAGSGDLNLDSIGGEVRAETGSGNIRVNRPGGAVKAKTGSGDIDVRGARADIAVQTSSGSLTVEGDPPPQAFWDIRTSSGDIRLNVPSEASFTLVARMRSKRLDLGIPLEVTEKSSRELRGRAGKGEARVVVETSSGSLEIR
jgi:DUF4097 and DUF4098 domain-containing protein YvlB